MPPFCQTAKSAFGFPLSSSIPAYGAGVRKGHVKQGRKVSKALLINVCCKCNIEDFEQLASKAFEAGTRGVLKLALVC